MKNKPEKEDKSRYRLQGVNGCFTSQELGLTSSSESLSKKDTCSSCKFIDNCDTLEYDKTCKYYEKLESEKRREVDRIGTTSHNSASQETPSSENSGLKRWTAREIHRIVEYDDELPDEAGFLLDLDVEKHYVPKSLMMKSCLEILDDWRRDVKNKIDKDFVEKVLDDEIELVKTVCLGLVHPSQADQEKFTKWLQDTVIFHINDLKKKLVGEKK